MRAGIFKIYQSSADEAGSDGSVRLLKTISAYIGLAVVAIGLIVIAGWAYDLAYLKSISPVYVSMKANAAICFILIGLALWMLPDGAHLLPGVRKYLSAIFAAIVIFVGLLVLSEYIFGWDAGIDQAIFREPAGAVGTVYPGRIVLTAAFSFVLAGLAMLPLTFRKSDKYAVPQYMSMLGLIISLVAVIGYVYGLRQFLGPVNLTPMPLITALAFLLFFTGILLADARHGPISVFVGKRAGSLMLWITLPVVLLFVVLFDWLQLFVGQQGTYSNEFSAGVFTVADITVTTLVLVLIAVYLNHLDRRRWEAEEKLRRLNIQLEQDLTKTQLFLSSVLKHAPSPISVLTPDGHYLIVNKAWEEFNNIKADRAIGHNYEELFPASIAKERRESDEQVVNTLEYQMLERKLNTPEGERCFTVVKFPLLDDQGEVEAIANISTDMTDKKRAENDLRRVARALKTLSECNQSVLHADTELSLIEDICRKIVDVGEYRLAWVGYAEDNINKSIRPLASYGNMTVSPDSINLVWTENEPGHTPAGLAIRTGTTCVVTDIGHSQTFDAWRRMAVENGCASAVAFPLINQKAFGALVIYSPEIVAFDEEEVGLLKELADDLAYGITAIRTRNQRREAEKMIESNEIYYRSLIESSTDLVNVLDADGTVRYASPSSVELLGYPPEEVLGMNLADFMHTDDILVASDALSQLSSNAAGLIVEVRLRHKDGHWVTFSSRGRLLPDIRPGMRVVINSHDISARLQAQKDLSESYNKLQTNLSKTIDLLVAITEKRDPYTAGHQKRVTDLACAIAREMGLADSRVSAISMAGTIHDLGKINVPADLLNKPGKLSNMEFAVVKIHPDTAFDIIKVVDFPAPIADIVHQHHERMDGSGYPLGLHGEEILLESRILAVADVVEAMASHRPYRPALGLDKALEEIKGNKGGLYDEDVVNTCLRVFDRGFRFQEN
ncbi:MAG: HD domain-containing phosphohydrolase [Dehalococcoidia bacterium]